MCRVGRQTLLTQPRTACRQWRHQAGAWRLSPRTMSLSLYRETYWSWIRRWTVWNLLILIVSAVKICKHCLQTAPGLPLDPTGNVRPPGPVSIFLAPLLVNLSIKCKPGDKAPYDACFYLCSYSTVYRTGYNLFDLATSWVTLIPGMYRQLVSRVSRHDCVYTPEWTRYALTTNKRTGAKPASKPRQNNKGLKTPIWTPAPLFYRTTTVGITIV